MEPPKILNTPSANVLPAGAAGALLTRIPPGLAAFPPETLLTATVIRSDGQAQFVLRTPAGEVTVRSDVPFQPGTNLVLRVIQNTAATAPEAGAKAAPLFQAQVISVDGKPIAPPGNPALAPNPVLISSLAGSAQQTRQQAAPEALLAREATAQAAPKEAAILNISSGAIIKSVVTAPRPEAAAYLPPQAAVPPAQTRAAQSYQQLGNPLPPPTGTPASAAGPLRPADVLIVHVLGVQYPAGTPAPAAAANPLPGEVPAPPSPNQPAQSLPSSNPLPQAAPAPTPPGTAPLPIEVAPQASRPVPAGSVAPLTPQPSFTASVIGSERSGDTVLATPLGTLKLQTDTPLPKGAQIQLEVVALEPRPLSTPITSSAAADTEALKTWISEGKTALSDIASALQQRFGAEGHEALQQVLPNVQNGQQFASRLLWFIGGVYSNNAGVFLGPDVQKMLDQSGKVELTGKLQKDFSRLRQAAQDGLGNGWTSLLFPVMDGEKLEHGTMFSRRFREENADGTVEEGTRFVVELNMSNFGQMQLDGLYRRESGSKQFDLFVRTKEPLADDVKQDIRNIFTASTEAAGLKGSVQFQVVREFPISPMEEEPSAPHGSSGSIVA